jgi:hypothetical protein
MIWTSGSVPFQSFHDNVRSGGRGGRPENFTSKMARLMNLPAGAADNSSTNLRNCSRAAASAAAIGVPSGTAETISRYVSGDFSDGSSLRCITISSGGSAGVELGTETAARPGDDEDEKPGAGGRALIGRGATDGGRGATAGVELDDVDVGLVAGVPPAGVTEVGRGTADEPFAVVAVGFGVVLAVGFASIGAVAAGATGLGSAFAAATTTGSAGFGAGSAGFGAAVTVTAGTAAAAGITTLGGGGVLADTGGRIDRRAVSAGALRTTNRVRLTGSTALYPSGRSSIENCEMGPELPFASRACCNAPCQAAASMTNGSGGV